MDTHARNQRQDSQRSAFWVVFLTLVLVCLGFLLPAHFRRRDMLRTCDLLRPLIGEDARFKGVDVHPTTTGRAVVSGSVNSAQDATALRQLMAQAQPPQQPIFLVRVITSTNDIR